MLAHLVHHTLLNFLVDFLLAWYSYFLFYRINIYCVSPLIIKNFILDNYYLRVDNSRSIKFMEIDCTVWATFPFDFTL